MSSSPKKSSPNEPRYSHQPGPPAESCQPIAAAGRPRPMKQANSDVVRDNGHPCVQVRRPSTRRTTCTRRQHERNVSPVTLPLRVDTAHVIRGSQLLNKSTLSVRQGQESVAAKVMASDPVPDRTRSARSFRTVSLTGSRLGSGGAAIHLPVRQDPEACSFTD